jgi:hypothetical protein
LALTIRSLSTKQMSARQIAHTHASEKSVAKRSLRTACRAVRPLWWRWSCAGSSLPEASSSAVARMPTKKGRPVSHMQQIINTTTPWFIKDRSYVLNPALYTISEANQPFIARSSLRGNTPVK